MTREEIDEEEDERKGRLAQKKAVWAISLRHPLSSRNDILLQELDIVCDWHQAMTKPIARGYENQRLQEL